MSVPTITVTLRLFAQVRVAAGQATVLRDVGQGTTARELAAAVLDEYGLSDLAGRIVLAIDGDWADPDVVLHDGAWLSLVPPVSGGAPPVVPVVDVAVTETPLEIATALSAVSDPGAGGTVVFQGTPRDVDALEFEAHEELARTELARIGGELAARHGLHGIALHHRLGSVPVGEAALVVVTASAHRGPAFEAAREALDEIKQRVPIWKAEVAGGRAELVEGQTVVTAPTVGPLPGGDPFEDAPVEPTVGADAPAPRLTHVAADGSARMVDVSDKAVTDRSARAVATVRVSPQTARLVAEGSGPKGDVLATARLAGIMAAKRAADLVPLAHPLPLTKVDVSASVDEAAGIVRLEGFARTTGKTGVEIEALAAVLVAALVVYDMVKAVEQHAIIDDVRVVEKVGGRRDFVTGGRAFPAEPSPTEQATAPLPAAATATPAEALAFANAAASRSHANDPAAATAIRPLRIAAVHVSTSRTAGTRPDRSRGALAGVAARTGWTIAHETMVADDRAAIAAALREAAAVEGVQAVLTLGGTGVTIDDVTPDATAEVIDREIPGVADALRAASLQITPLAALSRGIAGALGDVIIVNLPGSPKALAELESLLSAILPHAAGQLSRPAP